MKPVCAITGSNGYVGGCLKNYFTARGWEILELTRQPKPGTRGIQFQLGAEIFPRSGGGDAPSPGISAARASQPLAGVDALVHCAYDFKPLRRDEIRAVNVDGARKLFQAARAAGVGKIICISSISAYKAAVRFTGRPNWRLKNLRWKMARWRSGPDSFTAADRAGCSAN